jgi:D-glycero-D-manno-heptose 1,7-bisphosphate phosphatase
VKRLTHAGYLSIVVTNQSGIARGYLSDADYRRVADRIDRLLDAEGARLDAVYYCPHHPDVSGPCECRKPGLKHYQDATARFGLDLGQSVWIGDRITDLLPARALGGRGILVRTGGGESAMGEAAHLGFEVVRDLERAVDLVLSSESGSQSLY